MVIQWEKVLFLAHRWWLEQNHPYKFQIHLFDRTIELHGAPSTSVGSDILLMLKDVQPTFGKRRKGNFKKRTSIESRKRTQQVLAVDLDSDDDELEGEYLREVDL